PRPRPDDLSPRRHNRTFPGLDGTWCPGATKRPNTVVCTTVTVPPPHDLRGGTTVAQIIGQICFNVTDIERSIDFWENVMGVPLQSRTEIPGVLEAVHQAPEGGSRIQLAQWTEREGPIDMGTSMWKIYVNTSDVQALFEKAVAYGCAVETEPTRLDRWPVTVAL